MIATDPVMITVSSSPTPRPRYRPRGLPADSPLARVERDLLQGPSAVPLWYRLVQLMRELIERGELQPWEQLPAEQYVAEHLHISRPTVRQAWLNLENLQLIVRDHGKGTFVKGASEA